MCLKTKNMKNRIKRWTSSVASDGCSGNGQLCSFHEFARNWYSSIQRPVPSPDDLAVRLLLEIFWASKDNFRTGACGITMEKRELVKMGLGPENEVATAI